ncbi:MAG: 16S rRNA (guanine(527)-N(7))-methyltransferase RsmG [Pirellulaceae bacterium]|nr:16S rRNA (guanine(527)-N(7))-methyltransferase RsmG [Pirellulaceae bacterium]
MQNSELEAAIRELDISVPDAAIEPLAEYCRRLWAWNEQVNLTRHTTFQLFARRDLLDTVRLASHLPEGHEVLDVGTGGGVPGVVLAILRPDLNVSLCDSTLKKARIVQEIVQALELPVAVYHQNVQTVLEDLRFHALITRATGSISRLLQWLDGQWLQFDRLLAIKGPRWTEERAEARHRGLLRGIDLRCLETYNMPGTQSDSAILCMTPKRTANAS